MSTCRGICVISVPKSGTMLLSRCLERMSGAPAVFGLRQKSMAQLADDLDAGWHPAIRAAADPRCLDTQAMCRRYAQMLARHRNRMDRGGEPSGHKLILSDHGYSSFLQFLVNPSVTQILEPAALVDWAREHRLAPVFLYRSIPEVANSLAWFLAGGKSFLLSLRHRDEAAQLVVDLYAPVIAAQTAAWLDVARRGHVLLLSYEALIADPARHLLAVAGAGHLSVDAHRLASEAAGYRSWTYRMKSSGSGWRDTFTQDQQQALLAMNRNVGMSH